MKYSKTKMKELGVNRLRESNINHQGCEMFIDKYNSYSDIIVKFKDNYGATVHTDYKAFKKGEVKNPYYPTVCEVGIIGNKYIKYINGKPTKEYTTWYNMIKRCYDKKEKEKHPTYKDIICCKEWLLYENFYEWLHNQENFDKWLNNSGWDLDKDILIKGNKVYSPDTCCLVPQRVNKLFIKNNAFRGNLPIGVTRRKNKYIVQCDNPNTNKMIRIYNCQTIEEAFQVYKKNKEDIIKQVAQIEYDKRNITRECYEAMMNYEVEITD